MTAPDSTTGSLQALCLINTNWATGAVASPTQRGRGTVAGQSQPRPSIQIPKSFQTNQNPSNSNTTYGQSQCYTPVGRECAAHHNESVHGSNIGNQLPTLCHNPAHINSTSCAAHTRACTHVCMCHMHTLLAMRSHAHDPPTRSL